MKFSDGMEFNLDAPIHAEHRSDGWYVVGGGMLYPVDSREEADAEIKRMEARRTPAIN